MSVQSLSRRERAEMDWAFLAAVHAIEPELRAPIPRRTGARTAQNRDFIARLSHAVLGVALCTTMALGVLLGLWGGFAALIFPLGATTTATVTRHEITRSADPIFDTGDSTLLHFKFRPAGSGRAVGGTWPVSPAEAARLPTGSQTTARYFTFAPALRPLLQTGESPWGHIFVMGTMSLIMLVTGGLLWRAFFAHYGKTLVRSGVATVGVIVARQGDSATVWFRPSDERGQTRVVEFSQVLAPAVWEQFPLGAPLTVLYQPRRLQHALVYADGDFIALA